MKNYLSTLRERNTNGWGGFHDKGPDTFIMCKDGYYHFCPVQTGNITNTLETVDIIYNLAECPKSDIEEGKTLIATMIDAVVIAYQNMAKINDTPIVEDIKAMYAGNDTTKFTIRVTTPIMKDGRYLIDDMLGRYYGNSPERKSQPVAIYKIKPVQAA